MVRLSVRFRSPANRQRRLGWIMNDNALKSGHKAYWPRCHRVRRNYRESVGAVRVVFEVPRHF